MPPHEQMTQFILDYSKWFDYIKRHLKILEDDYSCRHPACAIKFDSFGDLQYHLWDYYYYQPPRGKKRIWLEDSP
jgi:carbonic anhydrase